MRSVPLLALFALLAAFCPDGRAAWGPRGCGPVGPPVFAAPPARAACSCSQLCTCGCQSGHQCVCVVVRPGAASAPTAAKPAPNKEDGDKPYFGVVTEKIGPARIEVNGKEVDRKTALDLVMNGVPDDAHKLRLTVIGSADDRRPVITDLASHPALADARTKCVLQAYPPDHWAVKDVGFKTDGKPTIYLQQPGGQVLLRLDSYEGPDKLALAIRKADPAYKPELDPTGKETRLTAKVAGLPVWGWLGIGAAAVAFALFVAYRRQHASA